MISISTTVRETERKKESLTFFMENDTISTLDTLDYNINTVMSSNISTESSLISTINQNTTTETPSHSYSAEIGTDDKYNFIPDIENTSVQQSSLSTETGDIHSPSSVKEISTEHEIEGSTSMNKDISTVLEELETTSKQTTPSLEHESSDTKEQSFQQTSTQLQHTTVSNVDTTTEGQLNKTTEKTTYIQTTRDTRKNTTSSKTHTDASIISQSSQRDVFSPFTNIWTTNKADICANLSFYILFIVCKMIFLI